MESQQEKKTPSTQEKFNTVRTMMETSKHQMQDAMPYVMNLDRSIRLALTTFQKNPGLLDCHPATLIGAVIQLTQLGLELDSATNQAHLVPFFNTKKNRYDATLIVGYKGLEKMAIRSGQIKRIVPRVVHSGDAFQFHYGLDPKLEHEPKNESSDLTHVYAIAYLTDGGAEFLVMTKDEVEKIRSRSRAGKDGPWVTDYEEMALKTVTRKICKRLPNTTAKSQPLHEAIALDEKAEINQAQDLGILADPEEKPTEAIAAQAPKVDVPSQAANSERTLADRWRDVQELAKKHGIDPRDVLKELKFKEVNNGNIEMIETVLNEFIERLAATKN